jgi:hypothetical protein
MRIMDSFSSKQLKENDILITMKKKLTFLALLIFILSFSLGIGETIAQDPAPTVQTGDPAPTCSDPANASKPECKKKTISKNDAANFDLNIKLNNPLKVNDIQGAIKYFMNVLIKIALPFIVIFFLWSGLKFILAQGKPDKITEARRMFWYTIIGTLLILGAWTITNAIIGTVNSLVG